MSFAKATMVITIVLMLSVASPVFHVDAEAAEGPITVTDGIGHTYTFDEMPEKMVTIGLGFTSTAIRLGLIDRIIVCDKYSNHNEHEQFDQLKRKVDAGDIKANGSAYSTDMDALYTDIVSMTEKESLGTDDVVVFLTGTTVNNTAISERLNGSGYNHVLCWESIDSYESIVDFVRTMSLVMTGEVDPLVYRMGDMVRHIEEMLSNTGVTRREAFYVTYSGGELKVGNMGSLANSLIVAAGGRPITEDADKPKTYTTNLTKLIEEHGVDVVIFIDNTLASNHDNMHELMTKIGNRNLLMVHMDQLWNNYCIESMEGVWAMACAMYQDADPVNFDGDVPWIPNEDNDKGVVFSSIAGIVGALIICAVTILYLRR